MGFPALVEIHLDAAAADLTPSFVAISVAGSAVRSGAYRFWPILYFR